MAPSVDGRIVGTGWAAMAALTAAYERTANTFGADAWIAGRVSMQPYAGKAKLPRRKTGDRIPRTDFIARSDAESYAITIDASGKIRWKSNAIDDEHVITILSERVSDDYLAFLQSKGVSYVFGGKTEIDLSKVLVKLRKVFEIRRLLLEGGGNINGSFLRGGLIDELSLLIAPVADGSMGTPTLFDTGTAKGPARKLRLVSLKKLDGGIVWLRYRT